MDAKPRVSERFETAGIPQIGNTRALLKDHWRLKMQISDTELKKLMHAGSAKLSPAIVEQLGTPKSNDEALIKALTHDIINMPDREDRVAELKAKIDAGEYKPTSEEIAEAMWRRAIADRVK